MKKTTFLVLGGNGFIGSNLVERLSEDKNISIVIFGRQKGNRNDVVYETGDFENVQELESVFKRNRIDVVVHLISSTLPAHPDGLNMIHDIDSNLISSINLLNLMNKYNVKKLVFASSGGTVYGSNPKLHRKRNSDVHSEGDLNYPISSHGIVKLTIEKYIHLYNYHYGIKFLILRLSNPYGELHFSNMQGLINVALKNILLGKAVDIWGDGSIVRDYIYIKDCIELIFKLIENDIYNEVVNIGSGLGHSVLDVLNLIKETTGEFEVNFYPSRKFDVNKIVLNVSKLQTLSKFDTFTLKEGIQRTFEWTRDNIRIL